MTVDILKSDMKQIVMTAPNTLTPERVKRAEALPGEVLVQVIRCGVCGSDPTILHGKHPWAICPLVLGHEFSGVVAEQGAGVNSPPLGTRVAVIPHRVCGKCWACQSKQYNLCETLRCMGAEAHGGHAEFVSVPAEMVIPIADDVTLEDAAMLEPACVGLHAVKRVDVQGKTVLVVGAGPIGVFTAQSARALGARQVYVADIDPWRLTLAGRLGVTGTFNLQGKKLDEAMAEAGVNVKEVDVFFDCVGMEGQALDEILRLARRGTTTVVVGVLRTHYELPHLPDFVQHELALFGTTMYTPDDYRQMIQLMAERKVTTEGMITHTFTMDQIPEVFRFIDERREPFFKIMLKMDE